MMRRPWWDTPSRHPPFGKARPRKAARVPPGLLTGWLLAFAAFAVAVAARWPIIGSAPYGDEGLHYLTARSLGAHSDDYVTDIWGHAAGGPAHLLWQRPLFYVAFALPAQFGFAAFRVAASLSGALMAPVAYGLLRAHAVSRPAAFLGSVAVAATPVLVLWSNLALMDGTMTTLALAALWARAAGRHGWQAILGVAAAWTKESALLFWAALLVWDLARGLWTRQDRLWPTRLSPRTSAAAWSFALGIVPIVAFVLTDYARIGGLGEQPAGTVLNRLFASQLLVPVLGVGLLLRRSRFLAGAALAAGALLFAVHLRGQVVPGWYGVPVMALTLVGAAATCDAAMRAAWATVRLGPVLAGTVPAMAGVAIVAALLVVPAGPIRDAISNDGADNLEGIWEYETRYRDADLAAALEAIPLGPQMDLLAIDVYAPRLIVQAVGHTNRTQLEWTLARSVYPVDVAPLAARIEHPEVWIILEDALLPMNLAIRGTYAECTVLDAGRYTVIYAAPCSGRANELEASYRFFDPRY